MIDKPHPVLAVPVIALVDGVLMAFGNRVYEVASGNYSIIAWPGSFWLLFWYTMIFATIAGVVLAPFFYFAGQRLPEPKLIWLLLFGALLGPIPLTILDGHLPNGSAVAAFSVLGVISAAIWWLIVEAPRSRLAKQ